jgi:hypothetical membrane protein
VTTRQTGLIGIASAVLFWSALVVFGSLDPTYSHATRAVSELGMVGAPHQWAWNVVGFILPGLLLAWFGFGMARAVGPPGSIGAFLLCASGILFAATGVFAADLQDMGSFTTRAHIWASYGSLLCWLPAPILIAVAARRRSMNAVMWASIVGLVCLLAGVVLGHEFLSRGFAQRLNFATYFAWVLVVSMMLLRQMERRPAVA